MRARALMMVLVAMAIPLSTSAAEDSPDQSPEVRPSPVSGAAPVIADHFSLVDVRSLFASLTRPRDDIVRIAFTGDTLVHLGVTAAAARNGRPYDFRPMFTGVRHLLSGADLAICHLEVPLSPTSSDLSSFPLFNAPAEVADGLAYAGYDGCSTASNHSFDRGVTGVKGTIDVLKAAGVRQSGTAMSSDAGRHAELYQVDGLTIGHISATYWLNGLRMPADMPWLVQLLDSNELIRIAARAKGAGADLVVLSMHCCTEYAAQPTAAQLELSHALIKSRYIDLVVTHHSHMVGPVERVGDEFILHGLGNFLSGQRQFPALQDGVITFANARRVRGQWRFTSVEAVPTEVARGTYRIRVADVGSPSYDRTMEVLNSMGARIAPYQPAGLSADVLRLIE